MEAAVDGEAAEVEVDGDVEADGEARGCCLARWASLVITNPSPVLSDVNPLRFAPTPLRGAKGIVGWAGALPPRTPPDPDVPNSGIRLFVVRVRYVYLWTMIGRGSG